MKKTLTFIGLGLVLVSLLGVTISCQGPRMGRHGQQEFKEYLLYRLTKELQLTEDQRLLIEQSLDEVHQKARDLHADAGQRYAEVKTLILEPGLTEERINILFDEHHLRMTELRELVVRKLVQIHSTLTVEQKEQLVKVLERFAEKMNKKF